MPDLHFTEYSTRVAAYAVILDERDRILLSWFNGSTPGWTLPGGGVDYDESIEEAVVREVREETGYDVVVGQPLGTHVSTGEVSKHTGGPHKSVRIFYDATVVGGTLGTTEVDGTTDFAQWVPLADLDRPQPGHRADIVDVAVSAHRARHGQTQQDR